MSSSPETHILLQQNDNHKSNPASPHDLAQMTNVSVLDLHKDYSNETKIYDKSTNTVYVYSNGLKIDDAPSAQQQHQLQQIAINQTQHHSPSMQQIENGLKDDHQFRLLQDHDGVIMQKNGIDGRPGDHLMTKMVNDDPIFRYIDTNNLVSKIVGENQQIISRDIINGEHHIITRNENGEHILTRIVNTSNEHAKPNGNNDMFNNALVGSSTLHLDNKLMNKESQHIFTTTTNMQSNNQKMHDKQQIIYTTTSNDVSDENAINKQYESMNQDLIYEDGNKTVIYTTASPHSVSPNGSDQKNLEIYASGELGLINGTQVLVQGGLQYIPQTQPDGSTVYVVSEICDELNGHLQG